MSYQIVNSSLEDWSRSYTGDKFHAVLCDPPYGLKFMGKDWDVVSAKEWGEAMMPHLYPGALILMFGGTRTWHKLASGMEDAGFEMWDTLMWLYGQGFPKGQDLSKLIDKANGDERDVISPNIRLGDKRAYPHNATSTLYGTDNGDVQSGGIRPPVTAPGSDISAPWSGHKTTALKPAWEPILAFKKPLDGTYAAVAVKYGSGALNVDGGRIRLQDGDDPRLGGKGDWGTKSAAKNVYEGGYAGERVGSSELGRYPANLILDDESGALLDTQSGFSVTKRIDKPSDCSTAGDVFSGQTFQGNRGARGHSDSGGASRFFYCAKASTSERNAGLESLKNHHPTVKPLSLTQYLATLLLPPSSAAPRRLLVPFAGSGSEVIGALNAGWDEVVGIEREADYTSIAEARVAHHIGAH